MLRKSLLLSLFLMLNGWAYSQTISGSIKNSNGIGIKGNILVKNPENPNLISEFVISKPEGTFSLKLQKTYSKIIVEVKSFGYTSEIWEIENPQKDKNYEHNFSLSKNEKELEEIVVIGKNKPVTVKEDTVTYKASAYLDGSERKVQDLLKKLPGIDVNEKSGEIKYKGKTVSSVMLEGDDLFGQNYALGTKNINVGIVDQVQAIDNYSENPLLKGIENSDKVALNLKLKKGKTDLSGNLNYGSGYGAKNKDYYSIDANTIAINQKIKMFSNFTYNNVGTNNTPFDYFYSGMKNDSKQEDFFARRLLTDPSFGTSLEDTRSNVNNLYFGSINALYRFNYKTSLKSNLFYVNDKLFGESFSSSSYHFDSGNFTTTDESKNTKKPELFRADLELKSNLSKKELLQYNFRISSENIKSNANQIQNQTDSYNSELKSESFYFNNKLSYTNKINDTQVLQSVLVFSREDVPQTLTVNPGLDFLTQTTDSFTLQKSNIAKNHWEVNNTFLGVYKNVKYSAWLGYVGESNPLQTSTNNNSADFINDFNYLSNLIFSGFNLNYKTGKWTFGTNFSFGYLHQNIQKQNIKTEHFVKNPSIRIRYKLTSIASIYAEASYREKMLNENNFFSNYVILSSRNIKKNIPNLQLTQNQNYSLGYSLNDLYNQFTLNFGGSYSRANKSLLSSLEIQPTFTYTLTSLQDTGNENWSFYFNTDKYIPSIQTRFKIGANYGISHFKNQVNSTELRFNTSNYFNGTFETKTAFDFPVNFGNVFNLGYSEFKTKGTDQTYNNTNISNSTFITLKPIKEIFFSFSADYYLPNTKKTTEKYWFLDFTLRYTLKNIKWLDVYFFGKNLLDKKFFSQNSNSDYSESFYRSNLIRRYFMVGLSIQL